ncbi:hypothetical protein PLANPX_2534 [Lacipirellula parvula]|uniref:Uncharacterized protein n=1 Tax=Lacipirellula parvula TaxID=2650471 RepID=A0A5K7XAF7_9BACT|nr:hypothetical protein PLANPX_2534 [Lacipirellula parvula]
MIKQILPAVAWRPVLQLEGATVQYDPALVGPRFLATGVGPR